MLLQLPRWCGFRFVTHMLLAATEARPSGLPSLPLAGFLSSTMEGRPPPADYRQMPPPPEPPPQRSMKPANREHIRVVAASAPARRPPRRQPPQDARGPRPPTGLMPPVGPREHLRAFGRGAELLNRMGHFPGRGLGVNLQGEPTPPASVRKKTSRRSLRPTL